MVDDAESVFKVVRSWIGPWKNGMTFFRNGFSRLVVGKVKYNFKMFLSLLKQLVDEDIIGTRYRTIDYNSGERIR